MSSKNANGLTAQQERFAHEVAKGISLADAYRASYATARMKPETIHNNAYMLMQRSEVAARVAALQSAAADRAELDVVETIREVRRLASSDIRNIFHQNGRLKLPHELDADTAASISSVEIDAEGKIKYRLWDKNSALERAAKILGLFEKDNRQKTDPLSELFKSLSGNVMRPVKELKGTMDDED